MARLTWTARAAGSVEPVPANPTVSTLESNAPGFEQFDAVPLPAGLALQLDAATTSAFAFYIETDTSAGRRQFKFVPGSSPVELRFGYRYQVGLGSEARSGAMETTAIDLVGLAAAAEPGVVVVGITAVFVRLSGRMTIGVTAGPADPPNDVALTRSAAVRLLQQATFGANAAAVDEVMSLGVEGWIDRQLTLPASLTTPYVKANSNGSLRSTLHDIWWQNVMEGEDQLRQRVAFAWSEIFVVSDIDYELANTQYAISGYYDMLATEGLGSFRALLERVTLHPVMGIYLSMLRNERADPARNVRPDENFAREVLQLFTIGLYELEPDGTVRTNGDGPIPTYDQTTIEQFAKIFTGWNLAGADRWTSNDLTAFDKESPMEPVERYHDRTAKSLLGGVTLPAGQDAGTDLEQALDNIVAHPNVGPFVSRLLIQRLVTSNPSPGYLGRVAAAFADDGAGNRGNLAAVTRAILLDREARTGHVTNPASFGKIKEPVMRLSQLWRAFDATPGSSAGGRYRPYAKAADQLGDVLGQAPLRSPSVFNFFQPDYQPQPDSDVVAPEAQLLAEIDVASTNNMLFQQIYDDNNRRSTRSTIATINIDREVELAGDVETLLDHLDVLLVAGQLPADHRAAIVEHLNVAHPNPASDDDRTNRVLDAIFCIVGSPVHLVQK